MFLNNFNSIVHLTGVSETDLRRLSKKNIRNLTIRIPMASLTQPVLSLVSSLQFHSRWCRWYWYGEYPSTPCRFRKNSENRFFCVDEKLDTCRYDIAIIHPIYFWRAFYSKLPWTPNTVPFKVTYCCHVEALGIAAQRGRIKWENVWSKIFNE